jgi:hypothetical protein
MTMRPPGLQWGGSRTDEFLEQLDHFRLAGNTAKRKKRYRALVWPFIRSMLFYSFNVKARGLKSRMKAHSEVIKESRLAEEIRGDIPRKGGFYFNNIRSHH